jgi:hypothetical protein
MGSIGFSSFIGGLASVNRCRNFPHIATRRPTGIPVVSLFRTILTMLLLQVWAFGATAEFPRELKLTNGATLRKCEPVRWTAESVVVRHAGGIDPIRFANIAPAQREAVQAARPSPATSASPAEEPKQERTFRGAVFVATVTGKTIPLGSVNVRAFPLRYLAEFDGLSLTVRLPKPLASTVTDADGKFALTVPGDEPFFFFAQSGRFLGGSSYNGTARSESYDWRVPVSAVKDPHAVLLTNANLSARTFNVTVSEN